MLKETRCYQKSLSLKDTHHMISVPLAMSPNLHQKVTNFKKKTTKKVPGQMWGQDRPESNSAKCLIRIGGIPSQRQTSIDKINDRTLKSERDALVRGTGPPSGHSVTKRPVIRGGRRSGV